MEALNPVNYNLGGQLQQSRDRTDLRATTVELSEHDHDCIRTLDANLGNVISGQ